MVAIYKAVPSARLCLEVGHQLMSADDFRMAAEIGFQQRYCSNTQFRRGHRNHLHLQFGIGLMKGQCAGAVLSGILFP